MATLIPEQIDALSHEMRVCAALAGELATTAARAFGRLQGLLEAAVEGPFKTPFETPLHLSGLAAWRAAHRVGTPSKIATDPELRAFVEARIGNLTFKDLAAEIADAFPPDRRVALSSLHRWWHRNRHGMAPAKGPGKSPRPKPPARVRHGSGTGLA